MGRFAESKPALNGLLRGLGVRTALMDSSGWLAADYAVTAAKNFGSDRVFEFFIKPNLAANPNGKASLAIRRIEAEGNGWLKAAVQNGELTTEQVKTLEIVSGLSLPK